MRIIAKLVKHKQGNSLFLSTHKPEKSLQKKYLDQIEDLYCDFHITKVPLFDTEVRGKGRLYDYCDKLAPGIAKNPEKK